MQTVAAGSEEMGLSIREISRNTSEAAQIASVAVTEAARATDTIRQLGESGLMVSSVTTMMHGVRGFFRFAHIDGLIPADPACTLGCPRCTAMSPAPRVWTGWS